MCHEIITHTENYRQQRLINDAGGVAKKREKENVNGFFDSYLSFGVSDHDNEKTNKKRQCEILTRICTANKSKASIDIRFDIYSTS